MARTNIKQLRLTEDYWNPEMYTDENSLANALLTEADVLSPVITHLAGRYDRRFPLSFLTEGMNKVKYIDGVEYRYPVIGELDKAVALSETVSATPIGGGKALFTMTFAEKHFVKGYIIESPNNNTKLMVKKDPEQVANGWEYTVQVFGSNTSATLYGSDLDAGALYTQLFAPVAFSGSRGNESNWVAPSKVKNQITTIRKSYRYEGNTPDRVVNVELPTKTGGTSKLWYPFEEWQHMLRYQEEKESMYWYSEYNRDDNGDILDKDDNGKPIPMGSGVLEQIPNFDTYSTLTTNKLTRTLRDVFFGASDAQKVDVMLYTGTGGREEFHNAIINEASGYSLALGQNRITKNSDGSLQFGGYFTKYEHVDGHTITVALLPLLDKGPRAKKSPRHAKTGLPIESYRMIFLDMSTYDGQANVQKVSVKGREMVRGVVQGFGTPPPGFKGNSTIASDVDGSSTHYMCVGGIQIMRATNCIHLMCTRAA